MCSGNRNTYGQTIGAFKARIYRTSTGHQDQDSESPRPCSVKTHMDMSIMPRQKEYPDQALAVTPIVRLNPSVWTCCWGKEKAIHCPIAVVAFCIWTLDIFPTLDPCHGTRSVLFDRQKQTRFCVPGEAKECKLDMEKHLSAQQPSNLQLDSRQQTCGRGSSIETLHSRAGSAEG